MVPREIQDFRAYAVGCSELYIEINARSQEAFLGLGQQADESPRFHRAQAIVEQSALRALCPSLEPFSDGLVNRLGLVDDRHLSIATKQPRLLYSHDMPSEVFLFFLFTEFIQWVPRIQLYTLWLPMLTYIQCFTWQSASAIKHNSDFKLNWWTWYQIGGRSTVGTAIHYR
jgi:hypothetical protein